MMTELEWNTSTEPGAILHLVAKDGSVSVRKLRLVAAGCCRRIIDWIRLPQSQQAIAAAARFADGMASPAELAAARAAAHTARPAPLGTAGPLINAWLAAVHTAEPDAWEAAFLTSQEASVVPALAAEEQWRARTGVDELPEAEWLASLAQERGRQLALIRDIIGNPFRPAEIAVDWGSPAVQHLVERIYNDEAFSEMPALADALEAADCRDAEILTHCRSGGPHVRGYWVVDRLLAKE
jgi:hypothetical protein